MNYFSDLIYAYKQIEEGENVDKLLIEFIQDIALRISTIRNESPRFKNNAFSEEKEWRLIINNHLSDYNCEYENDDTTIGTNDENYSKKAVFNNGFIRNPIQFLPKSNTIVPYFDLDFGDIKNSLVNKIYIGPKCKISELDLRLFLESYGYNLQNIIIEKSSATYR